MSQGQMLYSYQGPLAYQEVCSRCIFRRCVVLCNKLYNLFQNRGVYVNIPITDAVVCCDSPTTGLSGTTVQYSSNIGSFPYIMPVSALSLLKTRSLPCYPENVLEHYPKCWKWWLENSVCCAFFFFFLIFSLFHAFLKTFFNFLPSPDFDLDQGYTDENRKNFTSLLSTFLCSVVVLAIRVDFAINRNHGYFHIKL